MMIKSLWMRQDLKTLKWNYKLALLQLTYKKETQCWEEKAQLSLLQPLGSASLLLAHREGAIVLWAVRPCLVNCCLSLHCCHITKVFHSLNTQQPYTSGRASLWTWTPKTQKVYNCAQNYTSDRPWLHWKINTALGLFFMFISFCYLFWLCFLQGYLQETSLLKLPF